MAKDNQEPRAISRQRYDRLEAWSNRRPCIALMGEFSAGKSTLLNFLIEGDVLPTRATATELPPIWFSKGDGGSHWVDDDGSVHPIEPAQIGTVPMHARYVRIYSGAEILEHCDIVDTPGISDPNLAAESWRFAVGVSNMVLWCTSATQAWRETERGAWTSLPERLRKHSLLIVTRTDKLLTEADRLKVDRRLARETDGLFHARVLMSTPDAVQAKADLAEDEMSPMWEASGAARLLDLLAERFEAIYEDRAELLGRYTADGIVARPRPVRPASVEADDAGADGEADSGPETETDNGDDAAPGRLMPTRPQRVQTSVPRRTERPSGDEAAEYIARVRGGLSDEDDGAGRAALPVDGPEEHPEAEARSVLADDRDADATADGADAPEASWPDGPDAGDEAEAHAEADDAAAADMAAPASAAPPAAETELPRELRIWREIVARTAVSEANEQIVGMIDELLARIAGPDGDYEMPPVAVEAEAAMPDPVEPDATEAEAAEPDPDEPDVAEAEAAEPEPVEPDTAEAETVELDPDEPDVAEAEAAVLDPTEADAAEVETAELGPDEADAAEVETAELDPDEADAAEAETAEHDPDEADAAEVQAAEPESDEMDTAEAEAATSDPVEPDAARPDSDEAGAAEPSDAGPASTWRRLA